MKKLLITMTAICATGVACNKESKPTPEEGPLGLITLGEIQAESDRLKTISADDLKRKIELEYFEDTDRLGASLDFPAEADDEAPAPSSTDDDVIDPSCEKNQENKASITADGEYLMLTGSMTSGESCETSSTRSGYDQKYDASIEMRVPGCDFTVYNGLQWKESDGKWMEDDAKACMDMAPKRQKKTASRGSFDDHYERLSPDGESEYKRDSYITSLEFFGSNSGKFCQYEILAEDSIKVDQCLAASRLEYKSTTINEDEDELVDYVNTYSYDYKNVVINKLGEPYDHYKIISGEVEVTLNNWKGTVRYTEDTISYEFKNQLDEAVSITIDR